MKWRQKGYELEYLLNSSPKIYLYGAGKTGELLLPTLSQLGFDVDFIDSNVDRQGESFYGKQIYSLETVNHTVEPKLIIITASAPVEKEIALKLQSNGYQENRTFFKHGNFLSALLPCFYYRKHKRLMLDIVTIPITQRCTLNCRDCAILTPHIIHKRTMSLAEIKANIDSYFDKITYTNTFCLIGGEPFLHHNLGEILVYLDSRYKSQYGTLQLTTNGMIIPDVSLTDILKQCRARVVLSDYSMRVASIQEPVKKFMAYLCDNEIAHIHYLPEGDWVDFGFTWVNKEKEAEEKMIAFFNACQSPCRTLYDQKIYFCQSALFSHIAGFTPDDTDNSFRLDEITPEAEMEFLEWNFGFSDKGYKAACRKCNGYIHINTCKVPAAVQADHRDGGTEA